MNNTLRSYAPTDTRVRNRAAIASIDAAFLDGSSDRLRAFRTRFSPSNQSFVQKLAGVAVTAGIYAAAAVAFYGVSTANIVPLLHAFHLNVV